MATVDFSTALQTIRREWRQIMPQITEPAKQRVNGETSWICPICGHGTHGDGLTFDPTSKDGNSLKCFGCGWSGDITALYMKETGRDFAQAVTELADKIGISLEANTRADLNSAGRPFKAQNPAGSAGTQPKAETQQRPVETAETEPDFSAYYEECRKRIEEAPEAINYLRSRGVLEAALAYGAGFDPQADPIYAPGGQGEKKFPCPRIIIPCGKGYYHARRIDGMEKLKAPNPKGSRTALFNDAVLYAPEVQEVFITEGLYDALSIIQAGQNAVALNSATNARKLLDKLEERPTKATLILCLDNDDAGKQAEQALKNGLQRLKLHFIAADINNGHKDPNDALQADYFEFCDSVKYAVREARTVIEEEQRKAQEAERERQRRTGAGMIDAFLETVTTERYKPVPTGITDIDKALYGGFTRQQLILLGAAPGAGKTALAQWIFEGMAQRGQTVLYLNLEMSREQILARSISRIAAQDGKRITPAEVKQGYRWTEEQREIVTRAAEEYKAKIAPHMIYNPDNVTADLDGILKYLEEEANRAEAAGLQAPLVVIDYLQIINGREREDAATLIKRAVGSFKKFAIEHNTVIFAIIAHNRAANQSGTVTMESGRDTSALEYSADLQLGLAFTYCLTRPGQDKKEAEALTPEERRYITLKVTKGRDAQIGAEVDLYFNGETMTYTQIAREFEERAAQTISLNRYGRRPS